MGLIRAIIVLALVVGVCWLLFLGLRAIIRSDAQHQAWISQHCKVIGTVSGSYSYAYVSSGHMASVYTPGSTTYKCDNGTTDTEQN